MKKALLLKAETREKVGKHAFNYAQIFSTAELKRPMRSGLLNPTERDSLPVLNAIIGELLGDAKEKKNCARPERAFLIE